MRQRHPLLWARHLPTGCKVSRPLPLPRLWLVSDARNHDVLEQAIAGLPRGSGLIYRHYHLSSDERRAHFARLKRLMHARGGLAVLAGTMAQARRWAADGAYGGADLIGPGGAGFRLVTVHSLREITQARRQRHDALILSPAFATRSHPGAKALGTRRWRALARHAKAKSGAAVIALGGMNVAHARQLGVEMWAAIDGLSKKRKKVLDDSATRA